MDDTLEAPPGPARSLRLLDLSLKLATLALGVVTLTALAVGGAMLVGARVSLPVAAEIQPPFFVTVGNDSIDVEENFSRHVVRGDDPSLYSASTLRAKVYVGDRDSDSRVVMAAGALAGLALAWVGLVNLRRVVRSSCGGEPFDARNVGRLRLLAAAILGFALVGAIVAAVLSQTLDVGARLDVLPWGPPWVMAPPWPVALAAGAALLALAEVFREGARLRDLDLGTI